MSEGDAPVAAKVTSVDTASIVTDTPMLTNII